MVDRFIDPYARPAGELSEAEKRIIVAAFAAPALATSQLPRVVPIVLGVPVLIASNTKSIVLLVSIQSVGLVGQASGVIGSQPNLFAGSAPRVVIAAGNEPFQQILLAREQLWFVPDGIAGAASLSVTEVTP